MHGIFIVFDFSVEEEKKCLHGSDFAWNQAI